MQSNKTKRMIAAGSVAVMAIIITLVVTGPKAPQVRKLPAPAQQPAQQAGTVFFVYKVADNSMGEIRSPENWVEETEPAPPEPFCHVRFNDVPPCK